MRVLVVLVLVLVLVLLPVVVLLLVLLMLVVVVVVVLCAGAPSTFPIDGPHHGPHTMLVEAGGGGGGASDFGGSQASGSSAWGGGGGGGGGGGEDEPEAGPTVSVGPHRGVRRGGRSVAGALLALGARVNDVADDGFAAIHAAAGQGNLHTLGRLIRAGAHRGVRDKYGRRADQVGRAKGPLQ